MADGYLEKRMEDYLAGRLKPSKKKTIKKPIKPNTNNNTK